MKRTTRRPLQRREQFLRRIEVAKALGEIDGSVTVRESGHSANEAGDSRQHLSLPLVSRREFDRLDLAIPGR
jgi:hypothetical protein